jgi:amino acid permease
MPRSFPIRKSKSSVVILYVFIGLLVFLLVQTMIHGVIEENSNGAVQVSFAEAAFKHSSLGIIQPENGLSEEEESELTDDDEESREGLDD